MMRCETCENSVNPVNNVKVEGHVFCTMKCARNY